jgi:hypothetical protein
MRNPVSSRVLFLIQLLGLKELRFFQEYLSGGEVILASRRAIEDCGK